MRAGAADEQGHQGHGQVGGRLPGVGLAPARSETARALMPSWLAVSAAPTVPECSTERPTFTPWLMPESTRSGLGPTAPSAPAMTERAGEASSP